ncbi:MAG TPA: DUF4175 family protein [Gemmatimonadaceae bacterium]|nr:DUF4175 family protein [Gemmatimonadaceae bacterium]
MASTLDMSMSRRNLSAAIRNVRNRWRLRLFLSGLTIVLGAALLMLLAGAWVMQHYRFEPSVVTGVRIGSWLVIGAFAVIFLLLPLLRRASDTQVALYLEEHDPTLEAMVLSAVESTAPGTPDSVRSPHLVARLVDRAVARTKSVGTGAGLEGRSITFSLASIAGIIVVAALTLGIGPTFLRAGARFIAAPWTSAEEARPYYIAVDPGNAEVARGGGQLIRARLHGFDAGEAQIAVQRGVDSAWTHIPLIASRDSGAFEIRLFDLVERTAYYVEANGVRSPVYHLDVLALPYVQTLRLEYHYPAYTGLPSETVDNAGDIAVPKGTSVTMRATTTMPVKGGQIVVEGEPPIPMTLGADGVLAGTMTVTKPGFYRIELEMTTGRTVRGSLDYVIDVLDDNGPAIAFTKPGRDSRVTSVEEVYVEVQATDDYGLGSVDLRYSVNGSAERVVPLYSKGARRTTLTAGHTFFLEELGLQPGDLVSYYARATDNDSATGGSVAKTDIYFMTVRPFDQSYSQSQEAQRAGQGDGQGASPGELSQRQREIIAATFKVDRDSARMASNYLRDNFATLVLSQGRLRAQVDTLVQRLVSRGIVSRDSVFRIIAEELPKAGTEMRAAEQRLGTRRAREALGPEQRALQHLQRAEAAFREIQVQFGSAAGGGGGGSSDDPRAEDLADLFELQQDQLRNQYETEQRASSRSSDNIVDETAEKLKQLAARQQQENERLRNRFGAGAQSPSGGGNGSAQRQLAEETEKAARQLERLAREQPGNRELQESARRLDEAAKAMRRAATGANDGGVSQSASALQRLNDARRLLDKNREGRSARDANDVAQRGERIAREQRAIAEEMQRVGTNGTPGANGTPPGSPGSDGERAQRLMERQDSLASAIDTLESRLGKLSRESMRDQPEASRQLRSAADDIRQSRLSDQVRYSKGLVRDPSSEYARAFSEQLTRQTDSLEQRVSRAADALRDAGREQRQANRTLEQARDLVRGLESLEERTRDAHGQSGRRLQGEPGQQAGSGQRDAQGARGGGGTGGVGGNDVRQLTREYRERQRDAEELRRALRGQGMDTGELDRAIQRMRALGVESTYEDQGEVNRLQSAVTESVKAFEFALRRAMHADDATRPVLGADPQVPERFKALVEEYYRSLGKVKQP